MKEKLYTSRKTQVFILVLMMVINCPGNLQLTENNYKETLRFGKKEHNNYLSNIVMYCKQNIIND